MIAYVYRNIGGRSAVNGPLLAQRCEFMSRHGMPVFFSEDQLDFGKIEGFEVEEATPGMVGTGFRDELLYTILSDGSVSALPLQIINIVNEYPHQPRRNSEQSEHIRREEQQEQAV